MSKAGQSIEKSSAEGSSPEFESRAVGKDALDALTAVSVEVGGAYKMLPGTEGAVGFTHFDTPSSEDNAVTVLLTKENMDLLPSQALVRINSLKDHKGSLDRT